jgi:polysaccharide export outer membrane protein
MILLLSSCGSTRNITYFSNLDGNSETTQKIKNRVDPEIQPDDYLSIVVSSLNPEANLLFNSGVIQSVGSGSNAASVSGVREGYLVDKSGAINFPVLGSIKLAGLTKEEATNKMEAAIRSQVKDAIVNIRFLNFKITVIGEVNRPSTFTVPTERISLIEALGLAGDMTAYGKRENVLIIREKDGIRSTMRANLNDKNVLDSPYFYLQQNDVVYVEPVKIKRLQGSSAPFYVQLLSAGVAVVSLLVIFIR